MLALTALAAVKEDAMIRYAKDAFELRDPCCLFCFSPYFEPGGRLYTHSGFRELANDAGFRVAGLSAIG
jgi:hypothetical protein